MLLTQLWLIVLAAAGSARANPRAVVVPRTADFDTVLAGGRPWEASRLIAPMINDLSARTPRALYLAATAASRWGGWPEVRRMLDGQPWLDSLDHGRPRTLLARAALEEGDPVGALAHARAALPHADSAAAGELYVLIGRALERSGARDSAARAYLTAADRLPQLSDWLLVRAASLTDSSAVREGLYARLIETLPRTRIAWTEATALEHSGDLAGAADRYAGLGDPLRALSLRLGASPDSAGRVAIHRELVIRLDSAGSREAIALLDQHFPERPAAEALHLARAAVRSGLSSRALAAYDTAFTAGLGTPRDRFDYAVSLARAGRTTDAIAAFEGLRPVATPRPLLASAAYHRARLLVRGGGLDAGRSALLDLVGRYPADTVSATALYLLGDLATDDGADSLARAYFRRAAARFPAGRLASASHFRAAIIALVGGQPARAARELDAMVRREPAGMETPAARYWAGRAWAAAGDSTLASERWEAGAAADPPSYYADLSRRRLGRDGWIPTAAPDSFTAVGSVDSGVARAGVLARIGLTAEARLEYQRLVRQSSGSVEIMLATAAALRAEGLASQAISLARRAQQAGAPPDARLYRLLYPVVHQDALLAEAGERGLDPSFVAALIRQESNFDPAAVSSVGARGLMQLMPTVGARLAQALGYPVWDPVLLYQPDVSLQLGTAHLRELTGRYDQPVRILAAYNAGASRVERWSKKLGADDAEIFAERIPFTETRDYVRVIQRNQQLYRALYAWKTPG